MPELSNCPKSLKSCEKDPQDRDENLGLLKRSSRIARNVTLPVALGAR